MTLSYWYMCDSEMSPRVFNRLYSISIKLMLGAPPGDYNWIHTRQANLVWFEIQSPEAPGPQHESSVRNRDSELSRLVVWSWHDTWLWTHHASAHQQDLIDQIFSSPSSTKLHKFTWHSKVAAHSLGTDFLTCRQLQFCVHWIASCDTKISTLLPNSWMVSACARMSARLWSHYTGYQLCIVSGLMSASWRIQSSMVRVWITSSTLPHWFLEYLTKSTCTPPQRLR